MFIRCKSAEYFVEAVQLLTRYGKLRLVVAKDKSGCAAVERGTSCSVVLEVQLVRRGCCGRETIF